MIYVRNHREKALDGVESIDVTSRGNLIQLSPFYAGPVNLYDDYKSQNVENAWQYSKAYAQHFDSKGLSDSYWNWAEAGWKSKRAERYPMGKDAKPKCSIWNKKYLDYVQARIKIYWPLYSRAVYRTEDYQTLKQIAKNDICLLDFDGRRIDLTGETICYVILNEQKKMGHCFVLYAMLIHDKRVSIYDLAEEEGRVAEFEKRLKQKVNL